MNIKNKLYGGEVELDFNSFRHQYTNKSRPVKSVTKVLGIINKPALINWAANMAVDYICEQIEPGKLYDEIELSTIWDNGRKAHWQAKKDAGSIGSFLHKWIEDYINGENPASPVNPELREAVGKFLQWEKDHKVKFLVSEQVVYSRKYNYAGTLDFICKVDGKMYIGDLKTSSGIYPEMLIQTAAYRAARTEEFPKEEYSGMLILRIDKRDATLEIAVIKDWLMYRKMLVAFLAAMKLGEVMDILAEYKPDQLK